MMPLSPSSLATSRGRKGGDRAVKPGKSFFKIPLLAQNDAPAEPGLETLEY